MEDKMRFEPTNIHLQKGDILTSKKGLLQKSAISEKLFIVKKVKYLGNGCFEIISGQTEFKGTKVKK
jgi:hypothetical protein